MATPKPTPSAEKDWVELYDKSQAIVKALLKAPSTAKFPGVVWNREEIKKAISEDGRKFRISAWVDSQNSFGAMIRTTWATTFESDGAKWSLAAVEFDGKRIDLNAEEKPNAKRRAR